MSNIIEINDCLKNELDIFTALTEPQLLHYFEPDFGLFVAESPKVIERAINAGYVPYSLLMEHKDISGQMKELIPLVGEAPIYVGDFDYITEITGFKLIRGALCAFRRSALPKAEDICRNSRRVAVLENVVNPTNIGAVFRSAAALNMDAVLLTPACSDPLYRRSSRVSMGTVFQIPWTYLSSDNDYPKQLREMGFRTAAMALSNNSVSIDAPELSDIQKLAVVLGTEGEGLADKTVASCDYTVKIPMSHDVDSLNVAAASAVAFWQLGR
ncbi:MAG: RNA methyltransferase [Ruminococcus sp.]|jgi:tRNA G18 (ribose-2'-O)-methylase SpoU|uniref:TrmH family RNA methyltransferase n=1 Tax=Ruminococcus sp. TaxID=41978 RepID=UPI001B228DDC|nr:RNA methyltransferase [Ruminococcus sp.]MBO7472884.1 RNA methyltransferase [Ruminococcus sp.]